MTALRNGEKVTDVLTDLKANIPYSQAFQDASKFSKGLRVAGALARPLNIVGGISEGSKTGWMARHWRPRCRWPVRAGVA